MHSTDKEIKQILKNLLSTTSAQPSSVDSTDVVYGVAGAIDVAATTVIAAQGASTQLAITTVSIKNSSETFSSIKLVSGTTEVRWETIAPARGGSNIKWEAQAPLYLGTNLPLSFICSNSAATVTCSASGYVITV